MEQKKIVDKKFNIGKAPSQLALDDEVLIKSYNDLL